MNIIMLITFFLMTRSIHGKGSRPKINLHFQVLRPPHGKAREGRIAGLFNRRERSHAGWVGMEYSEAPDRKPPVCVQW